MDINRKLAAAYPAPLLSRLAESLTALSVVLRESGALEEALSAAQEAVSAYRTLSTSRPEAFLPYLAGAMNNLNDRARMRATISSAI